MASPFATGPCDLFLQFDSGAISYLGGSQKGPRIQWRRQFNDVYVDLGGSVAFDNIYGGTDALLSFDLNRFNWGLVTELENVAGLLGANPFADVAGNIGSLLATEKLNPTMWVRFNYASKIPFAAAGMPAGLRFPSAHVMNESYEDLAPPNAVRLPLVVHCQRVFDPTYISPFGFGGGQWLLADNNMAGLPAGIN